MSDTLPTKLETVILAVLLCVLSFPLGWATGQIRGGVPAETHLIWGLPLLAAIAVLFFTARRSERPRPHGMAIGLGVLLATVLIGPTASFLMLAGLAGTLLLLLATVSGTPITTVHIPTAPCFLLGGVLGVAYFLLTGWADAHAVLLYRAEAGNRP